MKFPWHAPGVRLALAAFAGLLVVAAVSWLSLTRPWMGIAFSWDASSETARAVSTRGPAVHVPANTQFVAIEGNDLHHTFIEADFEVEPDGNLATYTDYRRFLRNQGVLATIQAAPLISLHAASGQIFQVKPESLRPVGTLPADFWVQVVVGYLAWMIASAVWVFRSRQASARYLLLNGTTILMFTCGAAVYTTRELAVPLDALLVLKTMNFGGGLMFCATLVALMLNYPRRIGWQWLGPVIIAAYALWFFVQALGAFDSMMVARRIPVFAAVLVVTVLAFVQWVRASHDPLARGALRWFFLTWIVGVSLFVLLIMVPQIIEIKTGELQGYSFLLFLLIYLGIALGIIRFRLFDLGIWWFRTLAWLAGAFALVILDLLFLLGMQLSPGWSLSLSLLSCALLWLPFRNWLWGRLFASPPAPGDLFKSVVHVSLAPTNQVRAQRWEALLRSLFDPLTIRPLAAIDAVTSDQDGSTLSFPAVAQSPALELQYPGGGRRLFTPTDLDLARQLVDMLGYVEDSRDAYVQGAREERNRIARDLHDDVGSLLVAGLRQPDLGRTRASMAQAIGEMRSILYSLTGESHHLDSVIADLRYELSERFEAAGIELVWQGCDEEEAHLLMLDYDVYKHLVSVLRELANNAVQHSGASRVTVTLQISGHHLDIEFMDNGCGFDHAMAQNKGQGLGNLQRRIEYLNGKVHYRDAAPGVAVQLIIPLAAIN